MVSFIKAFLYYPSSVMFILRHGLTRYFLLSGLISLVVGILIFGSVMFFSDDLGIAILSLLPFDSSSALVGSVSWIVTGLALLILALLLYKYVLLIALGPLMSPLSEKVEEIITGNAPTNQGFGSLGYSFARGINISVRNIAKEILLTVIVFVMGLIPFLSPISVVLLFAIQAYYLGCANTDYHLEKTHKVSASIKYFKYNKMQMLGNGAGFLLLLVIPFVGLLIAPVIGTVAATRAAIASR